MHNISGNKTEHPTVVIAFAELVTYIEVMGRLTHGTDLQAA